MSSLGDRPIKHGDRRVFQGDRRVYKAIAPLNRAIAPSTERSPRFGATDVIETDRRVSVRIATFHGGPPRFGAVAPFYGGPHDSGQSPRFCGGPQRFVAIVPFLRRFVTICGYRHVFAAVRHDSRRLPR
ncbi:hypothetical protein R1sor_002045 [Riccia sorocarpa]|uniref:Uncharacterized protein n=1 Tax=Riccia sorocarpa TaxID=122646 RepID=A0ABD3GYH4_9MARC